MEPQDDPEARIRELERSAAEYGATELGAGQDSSGGGGYLPPPAPPGPSYGAPYPQPGYGAPGAPYQPPVYGAPYGAPPRRISSGVGSWPFVLAGIVVILVVIGAGLAFVVMNATTRTGITTSAPFSPPTVAGGGGSVDRPPSVTLIEPVEPEAPVPPPGGQLSVAGVGENKTIACNESTVNVSGVSNTVTITGHCASLTVSGMDNVVTVDAADTINASGFDNKVTYHSGSPEITSGGSNIVGQG